MAGKKGMHRKLLNPAAVEVIREKIQAEKLINSLQDHVDGVTEMRPSQVTAALGLLKKRVPDLAAVEHTGNGDEGEIIHGFKWLT
jgi:hypothetical protein